MEEVETEEQALIPKLRFPEFQGAGNWEEKPLIELCEKISQGGTPDTSNPNYWNGSIEWLTPAEMGKIENRFITSTARKISELGLLNCSSDLLPINSVIISTRAPIGHLVINKSKMAINQGCKGLIPKKFINCDFLYYSLFNNKSKLTDLGAGNTFKELSASSLKSFEILSPSLTEQVRIAECLSSVDELIELHTKKLELLKAHKKGLMQKLFPKDGETVPDIRLDSVDDTGGGGRRWGMIKAGALFRNRIEKGEIGLPIYSVTMNDGMVKRSSLERDFDDIAEPEGNKKVCKHDIAYNMMRMWQGACGVASEDCMVSPAYVVLAPNPGVCSEFFGRLFKLPQYLQLLTSHSQGLTLDRLRLYYKDFAQIPVLCPSFAEQQKIAACLSAVDGLVSEQARWIDALKAHKRGLMQQLFPVVGEG